MQLTSSAARARSGPATNARPFLKWAGGKTQVLEQLARLMPPEWNKYHEPFLGGAAVFFSLPPGPARLSDINHELVCTYQAVRDGVEEVIQLLGKHTYEKEHYYAVREIDPETLSVPARAARMIFLNKTGFNGLYRVNNRGRFNVPFGRHRNPQICDQDNLRACAAALRGVEVEEDSYQQVVLAASKGDFVYFDPPYAPISETSDFTSYAPGGFGWSEQQSLAALFSQLTQNGVKAMLSNSNAPAVRSLYASYRIETVAATRRINSDVGGRGVVEEIVVLNY